MQEQEIQVKVSTRYLEPQSAPAEEKFVFAYTITIENHSTDTVQLLNRTWHITDANGKETQVQGDGVVGEQPRIPPGESYTYTSGTVLNTPLGNMSGAYGMVWESGQHWQLPVPTFRLAVPNILH